jgi:hypothetical protein
MAVAILGCLFGVLGIFTIGLLFVPLAFLLSVAAILSWFFGSSWGTLFVGIISMFISIVGLATSPPLIAAMFVAIGTATSP